MTNREMLIKRMSEMNDEDFAYTLNDDWYFNIICKGCSKRVNGKCPLAEDEDCKVDEIKWLSEETK